MSVGIDMIPKREASSGSASVSTLAKTTSPCASDADSKIGANIRQGPHQLAQKSTSTTPGAPTASSKVSLRNATVATCPLSFVRAHVCPCALRSNSYTHWGIPRRAVRDRVPSEPGTLGGMCRLVRCHRCGRPTWKGCGAHVEEVLGHVPPAERCRCRDDAGTVTPARGWRRLLGSDRRAAARAETPAR